MSKSPRSIIVTAALPYANGPIHIGHLVEYLQVDFWTRFQNMRGHKCHYFCADDSHGTAITLKAKSLKINETAFIKTMQEEHFKDFVDFEIQFKHYSSTHSETNKNLCYEIYESYKKNLISKEQNQFYCDNDKMFLPDRLVKGTCPLCGAENQYGDNCDVCSGTYEPSCLKSARCAVCLKETLVLKKTTHLFLKLRDYKEMLQGFVSALKQKSVKNKLQEWLNSELQDWAISRDEPYFGFPIPDIKGKYFYVWVDAPMGYLATAKDYCDAHGKDFKNFWNNSEIYHFIGKDIIYFHALFWPTLLHNSDYKKPDQVFCHGFLNVNGEKMSKSKGTFISARHFLNHFEPTYLRYYLASKLFSGVYDLGFYTEEFLDKTNSQLLGKITNLISRSSKILEKEFQGKLADSCGEAGEHVLKFLESASDEIADFYENRDFSRGVSKICTLADKANALLSDKEPWKLLKEGNEKKRKEAHEILTTTANAFRKINIYLNPLIPSYCTKAAKVFNENAKSYSWSSVQSRLTSQKLRPYSHLIQRLKKEQVNRLITVSK